MASQSRVGLTLLLALGSQLPGVVTGMEAGGQREGDKAREVSLEQANLFLGVMSARKDWEI